MTSSTTTTEIKTAIDYATGLLSTAIGVETNATAHRGHTIGAMGVAEGTLRTLASYLQLVDNPTTAPAEAPPPLALPRKSKGLAWQALADAVRARRDWLGMSQFDLTKAGGPSEQTLRRIEGCQRCTYDPRTLTRLEQALGWKPHTIKAILHRTADVPQETPTDSGATTTND
jgi:hypothetical protein